MIGVLTIYSNPRIETDRFESHDIFHPYHRALGWNYWNVLVDDIAIHEGCGDDICELGMALTTMIGCLVGCRPDQHVGYIGALEDLQDVRAIFGVNSDLSALNSEHMLTLSIACARERNYTATPNIMKMSSRKT